MQITYPRYVDGQPRPDLEPKFLILTKSGDRTKLPIFIHYNGKNHYNAIVPAAWGGVSPRGLSPRGGVSPRAGIMGRAQNSTSPKGRASVSPKNKPGVASPKRGGVSPKRGGGAAAATKGMAALGLGKK